MKNKVEQIIENYKKGIEKIDKQYEIEELKELDTKEIDSKIEYEKQFIEKLEFEGKDINKEMINRSKERLYKNIEEKNKKLEEYEVQKNEIEDKTHNMEKYKNSKVILPSGRETTQKEKDKLDKDDLKNKAIRELTQESINIEEQLTQKENELELKREEWNNFKYVYEKDENGNSTGKSINDDEITKIHEEFENIKKDIANLNEMQKDCGKYLNKLKARTIEDEKFEKAYNDAYNDEIKTEKNETEKNETEKNETEKNETEKNETEKNETEKNKNISEIANIEKDLKLEPTPNYINPHGKLQGVSVSINKSNIPEYVLTYEDGTIDKKIIYNENTNGMKLELKSYKKYLKEIKEEYEIEDKSILKNIDPYLINVLEQCGEEKIKSEIIKTIKNGQKVSILPVTYDMENLNNCRRLSFLRRKFTKIARNAKDNGFETVNFKDNLYRRARTWLKDFGKNKIKTSELKQLESGKDKEIDPNGPAITTEEQEKMPQVGTAFKENLKFTVEETKEVPNDKPLNELIMESKNKIEEKKAKKQSDDEKEI